MYDNEANFARRFFDFEYEDQPENIDEYGDMIDYMWLKARTAGITEEIRDEISQLLASGEDASAKMGFVFLPGKHEVEDILRMILQRMPDENL